MTEAPNINAAPFPFYDEKRETFYTADCMIDNREELVNALGVVEGTPSGRLLYLSYLKWGTSFSDHILGVFTFVIYLRNEKRIILYTDHTASRCLHYTIEEGRVIFSTTINPILQICPRQLCEKWLVACEAYRGPNMLFFPELTPFEDIFQVMCGHYIDRKSVV